METERCSLTRSVTLVEFLQPPSNPASSSRFTKLRLVFRPGSYVLIFSRKSGKNAHECCSRQPSQTKLFHAFGSKLQTGWSLQVWQPCATSPWQGLMQCGHLDSLTLTKTLSSLFSARGALPSCYPFKGPMITTPLSWALPLFGQKAALVESLMAVPDHPSTAPVSASLWDRNE